MSPLKKKKPARKPAGKKLPLKNKKFGSRPPSRTKKPVRNKPGAERAPGKPAENPAALALARRIAELALDKKALDVVILDVRGMTSYADYFVIASGESERQVSATADHVQFELKQAGQTVIGSEGFQTGQWVLLDYGEVVVHLFFSEVRSFYDLEGLWSDASREKVA